MKTLLAVLSLTLAGASAAHAQIYQPAATRGAVLGAIAGAVVGGHNHDRWGEGAVIGSVAGALLGAALAPQEVVYQPAPVYQTAVVPSAPMVAAAPVVQAQPQVVYVQSAPQVVYYEPAPRVVYAAPVVSFGFGYYSGPRYYHPYYSRGYVHVHGRR